MWLLLAAFVPKATCAWDASLTLCFTCLVDRLFHIDDVPSGAGEGIKDARKALVVRRNEH